MKSYGELVSFALLYARYTTYIILVHPVSASSNFEHSCSASNESSCPDLEVRPRQQSNLSYLADTRIFEIHLALRTLRGGD